MAEPQMVDPHDVVMTGENSFIRLSNDGGKTIIDRVSHWRVLWSPAGQGHVLFVESPLIGDGPWCTPTTRASRAICSARSSRCCTSPSPTNRCRSSTPMFSRTGHSLAHGRGARRHQRRRDRAVVVGPDDAVHPHHAAGRDEPPARRLQHLHPRASAQLSVNGEAARGKVFPQERFGKPSSSCCLAWSESWTEPR